MLVLLSSEPCFAGAVEAEPYNGVYIGADLGLITLFDTTSYTINGTLPGAFVGTSTNELGDFGVTGGGILGYDYSLWQKIKLGIEGYINGTSVSIKQAQRITLPAPDAGNGTVQQNYAWGFRALPGYEFYPGVVGHLILGYANAQFSVQSSVPETGFGLYQPIVNDTFTCSGFQVGVGLASMAYHNFSLRFDGLFTLYGSHADPNYAYQNDDAAYTGTYNNANLNTFEGDLTLSYKFA